MKKQTETSRDERSKNNRRVPKINISKPVEDNIEVRNLDDDEELNEGFGTWIRSDNGVEMMKLFVIANSILAVITMAWPSLQETYSIIRELIMGDD
ncbi:uncharacterized protein LOC127285936 [Leptopilina boulardi]|uniref:uncharacterized protein LOC127285936 n=1 Tax=Leptopilina boulardi TaxID=63433 RepID=UPI0021F65B71|nr:uncharacterized protein LOC127285936 [Leptopilina boulardi]XP_051168123.1 uncharacterized protein LOC127285936 [Leptopilina boulardi]